MRVLIAEDESRLASLLAQAVEEAGWTATVVGDGPSALAAALTGGHDVILLDWMLPGLEGPEVLARLRTRGYDTPVLLLTARGALPDRVRGLDAGADDYLAKPFELDELLARLRALLRRAVPVDPPGTARPDADRLRVGDLRMDPLGRRAWFSQSELTLSKTEFDLLELLARNEGIVLDHSTIYDRIWGYDFGPESKNLAVYVSYLRRKLEAAGGRDLIQTVRGVGYTVRAP